MDSIIIVTIKEWNILNYFRLKEKYSDKFNFYLITDKGELTKEYIRQINPKYIFFPHWSWIIPKDIYNNFECIVFHMTDLPYGRGGSPLQNLIVRDIYDTKITALRVDDGLDTGDIYLKENFNISIGSAEEIFIKLSNVVFEKMIPKFLTSHLIAKQQTGKITTFKRRMEKDSNLQDIKSENLINVYDFIRMLDADGYPKAYIVFNNFKIEFSEINMKNNKLVGRFEVKNNE